MKILVINTGSSSIKYELFDMSLQEAISSGEAERIGEEMGLLVHNRRGPGGETEERRETVSIPDHHAAMGLIVDLLVHERSGVVRDKGEITAVGHRVVHGGEDFHSTTLIDEDVMSAIKRNIPLAPLHNPANLVGIEVARSVFPDALQVAVFDTAFHQTIPMRAFLYAIPLDLYKNQKVRRYGFHGTSHAFVAERASEYLKRPLDRLNLITIHLGNGASMAAVKGGRCVDTSMGMTPLAGLVMGTRCGDLDPSIPLFLANHLGKSLEEIDMILNRESGLRGICGANDMREIIGKMDGGDEGAKIAVDLYTYRIKKYIGSYFAVLGTVDAVIFTAGIGENSAYIRGVCCTGLEGLGLVMDQDRNSANQEGTRVISSPDSAVKILVIPTNEELRIAQETEKVIAKLL